MDLLLPIGRVNGPLFNGLERVLKWLVVLRRRSAVAVNADGRRMAQNNDELVVEKLDRVLRLLAIIAVKGMSQTDQITLLDRAGFAPKEIAPVVGTTSNTVRVGLVSIRRAAAKGTRRRNVAEETDA